VRGSDAPDLVRNTASPIVLLRRSGYSKRAFSASRFDLNGFDEGVNLPSTYLKSSHCSIVLHIEFHRAAHLAKRVTKKVLDFGGCLRVNSHSQVVYIGAHNLPLEISHNVAKLTRILREKF
jgi:hypothetical protein